MQKRKKRSFTPEYRPQGVKLIQESGKTVTEVAHDAGGEVCSMSRRDSCWHNAPVERFFSTLKAELIVHENRRGGSRCAHGARP